MTTEENIALASAIIASISIVLNIVQATIIYKRGRSDVARDELIDSLQLLQKRLEFSRLFDVEPNEEIWEYGFQSLYELASICASAHVAAQHSRFAPDRVRDAVSELHDHVKSLRALHDSYSTFTHGKKGAPANLQRRWQDWERAKAALQVARPTAEKCKRLISEFLREQ